MNQLNENLGKEFWGILLFENNLQSLYDYLELGKMNISMGDFVDWAVFPEGIPGDIKEQFYRALENRYESDTYQALPSELTSEAELMYRFVKEALHLKYFGERSEENSFKVLYEVPASSFSNLMNQLIEKGFITEDTYYRLSAARTNKRNQKEQYD